VNLKTRICFKEVALITQVLLYRGDIYRPVQIIVKSLTDEKKWNGGESNNVTIYCKFFGD